MPAARILTTALEPNDNGLNASQVVVESLVSNAPAPLESLGNRLRYAILPGNTHTLTDALVTLIDEHRPDFCVLVGQAPGRSKITFERFATNLRDFMVPDRGNLDVHDYRSGTFVGFSGGGRLSLSGAGGTAFVQTGRGQLSISDSSFDRLRARSLTGNMTFERCRVRQIEATSVNGSIVYDGGSFEPGIARFESMQGDIAVGTSGAAQLDAHAAGAGKALTSFEHSARLAGRGGTQTAVVAGGGPVVTVTAQNGSVFLYDGSLRNRNQPLSPPWSAPLGALRRPADGVVRPERRARPPANCPQAGHAARAGHAACAARAAAVAAET